MALRTCFLFALVVALFQWASGVRAADEIGPIVLRTHVTSPSQPLTSSIASRAIQATPRATSVTRSISPSSGLTIVPTFDVSITSDPQAATIEATINAAIAEYKNAFSTPITVAITFKTMSTGLGMSNTFYTTANSYTAYRAALVSHSTSPDDVTALAHLSTNATDPGSALNTMLMTLPNTRALAAR